ncbi:PREDICTED: uncharacterized protein LOC107339776 isoform X2 [Acropora digitifera]|uniref:uncharacterized protein LOC107339776 isoform X2 n=1 Tax=Acropora digitifera TaxID=70779 RepID=UPI00077A31F6|nr:PREDICTED: uncharacterized protein LOC107339776 isoform X2 [Acropora digitifera]
MTAKSRSSNSRLSNDDKVGETPAENADHDMTENGQSETVEDQTVTVVESQVSVDINPLENDAFDKEEEEVDDFEEVIADGLSQLGRSADGIPFTRPVFVSEATTLSSHCFKRLTEQSCALNTTRKIQAYSTWR